MTNIKNITLLGKHQTYDLEVKHKDHQFYLANGVLTSNSHAVAYAIDSFWCAWLLTHYEDAWLTAYVESMLGTPGSKMKAFSELKNLGYSFSKIDINYADSFWKVIEGKQFIPSFLSCNGIGAAAIEEIKEQRPYTTVENMLYNDDGSWRPSKFNKRVLESLIKIEAFDSLDAVGEDKLFSSYKHMHFCLIENNNEIKKHLKKDPYKGQNFLYELAKEHRCEEWSLQERIKNQISIFGSVNLISLIPQEIIESLAKSSIKSLDDFDETDVYWFFTTTFELKKTKSGKEYNVVNAVAISGVNHRLNCWGKHSMKNNAIYIASISKNDFGFSIQGSAVKEIYS